LREEKRNVGVRGRILIEDVYESAAERALV